MLRPGIGLKDAPWLWGLRLTQEFAVLGLLPTVMDNKLYLRHQRGQRRKDDFLAALWAICSAHVDDVKGASDEQEAKRIMDHLESLLYVG